MPATPLHPTGAARRTRKDYLSRFLLGFPVPVFSALFCYCALMDTTTALDEIQTALREAAKEGLDTVRVDALQTFIDELKKDASESATDSRARFKAQHDSNLAEYRSKIEVALENQRTTVQSGHYALRTAILMNGAAAVALLAFLGSAWSAAGTAPQNLANFPVAMLVFVVGVLAAAIATGTNYVAAYSAARESALIFYVVNSISIVLVIVSYIAFIIGGTLAYSSFAAP